MIGPEDAVATPKEMSIDEINAAIPRSVYLSADGQTTLQIVLGVLLIGLVWTATLSYFALQDKHKADALHQDGHEAIATVTKVVHGRRSGDHVYYKFFSGETIYGGEAQEPWSLSVHAGSQLPIEFLPSDPSINHPSGWAWWTLWNLVAGIYPLGFFAAGLMGLVSAYQRRRLGRIGWVTEAKVIACAPKGSRFRVDYVFSTDDGTDVDGANEDSYDEYKYGAKIRVIYLRSNPKRNDTYPLADFPTVGS